VSSWGKLMTSPPARPCYVEDSCVVMLHIVGKEVFVRFRRFLPLYKILSIPTKISCTPIKYRVNQTPSAGKQPLKNESLFGPNIAMD
jgi:hypothetical protein